MEEVGEVMDNNALAAYGNSIRDLMISKDNEFTLEEIIKECKKMGIDDYALVYRVLDDLCRKDIITPNTHGYLPVRLSKVV